MIIGLYSPERRIDPCFPACGILGRLENWLAAARYIELNPVRAKLTTNPGEYPWSSAGAHIEECDDALVVDPIAENCR